MESFNFSTLILLIVVLGYSNGKEKDGFLFTMPRVLRHGTLSKFCLTLFGGDKAFRPASLSLVNTVTGDTSVKLQNLYPVGEQTCSTFPVPKPGDYELLLYNDTDILHDSVAVTVLGNKLVTLVQTDKPQYKPGQKVKFRILTLLRDLKPRLGKIKKIFVLDPNDIRVKQYLDVDSQGITSLDFQLSSEAKLGSWKIEVILDEEDESSQESTTGTFEVKEYVLPRFEVQIEPPSYILANAETIEGKICAKYTYGKDVKGFLDYKVCWQPAFGPPSGSCVHEVLEISGCFNFSVNATEVKGLEPSYYGSELRITASVTEAGTGVQVNKTHSGPSESFEPFTIDIDDYTHGFFKPGLPYYGKVTVKMPDGLPASGEQIKITAVDFENNLRFSNIYTTDQDGVIIYALCSQFTENTTSISIDAVSVRYMDDNNPSSQSVNGGLYPPRRHRGVRQWFSPSLSYIQIPQPDSEHKTQCGERLTLSIPFTTRERANVTFHYQVMARGEVIRTGEVAYRSSSPYPGMPLVQPPSDTCLEWEDFPTEAPPPPPSTTTQAPTVTDKADNNEDANEIAQDESMFEGIDDLEDFQEPIRRSEMVSDKVSNFLLDIPITSVMSPKFTLLVYHVLQDGEVVADSMEFEVEPCFENKVNMEFNHTTVLPGETIDIKLSASPGSVCGVGIVDKSVNILGGEHQITSSKIFKQIEKYISSRFADMSISYRSDDDYCEERINRVEIDRPSEVDDAYWHYSSKYVDAIQAFKASGFMVISNLNLETRPCGRNYPVFYAPLSSKQAVPGAAVAVNRLDTAYEVKGSRKMRIRSHFPETWLWDLIPVGDDGSTIIQETAPHTITKWVGNALCIDQTTGFGLSPLTSITTFQPFFLSLHLPYAAVRDERLAIMFTVHNYLEKCLVVEMTLDMGQDFTVHTRAGHSGAICICGGESYTSKYYVTPTNIGRLPIKAMAEIVPGTCKDNVDVDIEYLGLTDAVERHMLVKAEGVGQEYSHTSYMCSKDGSAQSEDVILPLPADVVEGSEWGKIQIIGDIMGPALSNLDNLVRVPTGCGEQNMVGFVPNILVLKYLTNTGRINEDIQMKAIKNMEIGYQREQAYRHGDGSYSAFGSKDARGSVWLTAFVVKSFAQARPYIFIDDKDMEISIMFLRRSQLENGCYRETGKVFSSYMMGGLDRGKDKPESLTALTAYVVIALLQADVDAESPAISLAMECINRDFLEQKKKMDPYSLALVAYANALYKPGDRIAFSVLKVLDSVSRRDGSLKYWSRGKSQPKAVNTWYYHAAASAEVEMTAYALLAYTSLFHDRAIARGHSIAMWLSQQRNPHGGFSSTQDTVVGLNALSEFAALSYSVGDTNMKIHASGDDVLHMVMIRSESANYAGDTTLMRKYPISKLPNRFNITATGVGCALVQLTVHYNKPPQKLVTEGKPSFNLKISTRLYQHDIDRCDKRTIQIYVGLRGNPKHSNGMSLITMNMVTAWTPIASSLVKLQSQYAKLGMKRHEFNEAEGTLTFYFDEFTRKAVEFFIDVEQDRDLKVSAPKPAEVKVFQYYDTDVMHVQSYNLKTTCGTKASIPRKPPQNNDENPWPIQVRVDGPQRIPNLTGDDGSTREESAVVTSLCPVCLTSKQVPENLQEKVCQSAAVYKAFGGRKGKNPLKLRHDLRPKRKLRNINVFAGHNMPADCDCSLLQPPTKRILILVKDAVQDDMVSVDSSTLVLVSNKKIEKAIRQAQKTCPLKSSAPRR